MTECCGQNKTIPAHAAASKGHNGALEVLAVSGGDVHVADKDQRTPALMVACNGHIGALEVLIGAGADMNAADEDG